MSALILASGAVTTALQDLELGTMSPSFKAMFKKKSSRDVIRHTLEGIAYAIRLPNLEPNPKGYSKPSFMCVSPSTGVPYKYLKGMDPFAECISGPGIAFYVYGGRYIFLCPKFWLGEMAPAISTCPPVSANRWTDGAAYMASYQTYVLIHELAHFYLGLESLGTFTVPSEIYPMNDCVGLGPAMSYRNPQNYQYYVACEKPPCNPV